MFGYEKILEKLKQEVLLNYPDLEINTSIWKAVDAHCLYQNNEKIQW